ncbi:1,4-dihydroxy-2-naphthoyl-CoA hydrolase [Mucilaginibacter gracilis]|uniref:1,4-dihydroxy-2-naphthoyl-CoA hydrolase n=1 Tax=Mucilaginibacter gracilis TaxID=423350 RepID=A0A495IXD5_9SPHI|nr:hotdog fold thioesterase [Mucilaginibacter gracilis]RKR81350.1 1,4-dihydroxy-2-naphthoyl-CoA hydrolase [Mucilaginibacter gracilis]
MSRLWFGQADAVAINNRPKNHIGALLGIEFTEIGDDYIKATMPVDERTHQPYGILHGGASVVLAESIGSIASSLVIDPDKYMAVGQEVNANHLRPVKSGLVTAVCTPIHIGGKTHVWDIKIYNDKGKMSCISRLTVAVIPKV